MIDDFANAIFSLNENARDLLKQATDLDKELDEIRGVPDPSRLEQIRNRMNEMCSAMRSVVGILEGASSPLDRFFTHTRGVRMAPDTDDAAIALDDFINSHKQQLDGMGIAQTVIEKLERLMREQAEGNMLAPVKVDQGSKTIDGQDNEILADLKKLQSLVCKSAGAVDKFASFWEINPLRACVKGVMGAAIVVVDITGVFTVPDVTGWVLFKAAKSTWSGGKMVKDATESIKDAFENLQIAIFRSNAENAPKIKLK